MSTLKYPNLPQQLAVALAAITGVPECDWHPQFESFEPALSVALKCEQYVAFFEFERESIKLRLVTRSSGQSSLAWLPGANALLTATEELTVPADAAPVFKAAGADMPGPGAAIDLIPAAAAALYVKLQLANSEENSSSNSGSSTGFLKRLSQAVRSGQGVRLVQATTI